MQGGSAFLLLGSNVAYAGFKSLGQGRAKLPQSMSQMTNASTRVVAPRELPALAAYGCRPSIVARVCSSILVKGLDEKFVRPGRPLKNVSVVAVEAALGFKNGLPPVGHFDLVGMPVAQCSAVARMENSDSHNVDHSQIEHAGPAASPHGSKLDNRHMAGFLEWGSFTNG